MSSNGLLDHVLTNPQGKWPKVPMCSYEARDCVLIWSTYFALVWRAERGVLVRSTVLRTRTEGGMRCARMEHDFALVRRAGQGVLVRSTYFALVWRTESGVLV